MAEAKTVKSLSKRLCEVLGAVRNVPKNGWNSFHRYNYIKEGDVADMVRNCLAEAGVFVYQTIDAIQSEMVTTKHGDPQRFTQVKVKYIFVNADDQSDFREVVFSGDALDQGDKGLYKALTGANKYFLMKTFMLGSDDDAEGDTEVDKANSGQANPKPAESTGSTTIQGLAQYGNQQATTPKKQYDNGPKRPFHEYKYAYKIPYIVPGWSEEQNKQFKSDLRKKYQADFDKEGTKAWYSDFIIPGVEQYMTPQRAEPAAKPLTEQPKKPQEELGFSDDDIPFGNSIV